MPRAWASATKRLELRGAAQARGGLVLVAAAHVPPEVRAGASLGRGRLVHVVNEQGLEAQVHRRRQEVLAIGIIGKVVPVVLGEPDDERLFREAELGAGPVGHGVEDPRPEIPLAGGRLRVGVQQDALGARRVRERLVEDMLVEALEFRLARLRGGGRERMRSTRSKTPRSVALPLYWKSNAWCEAQRGRLWVITGLAFEAGSSQWMTPSVVQAVSRPNVACGRGAGRLRDHRRAPDVAAEFPARLVEEVEERHRRYSRIHSGTRSRGTPCPSNRSVAGLQHEVQAALGRLAQGVAALVPVAEFVDGVEGVIAEELDAHAPERGDAADADLFRRGVQARQAPRGELQAAPRLRRHRQGQPAVADLRGADPGGAEAEEPVAVDEELEAAVAEADFLPGHGVAP